MSSSLPSESAPAIVIAPAVLTRSVPVAQPPSPAPMSQSRNRFLRQSAWLSFATVFGGGFMIAVHTVTGQMNTAQYEIFGAMLRLFLLMGIPSAGLQNAFARQTAAALSQESQQELARTTRQVLGAILLIWLGMLGLTVLGYDAISAQLKLGDGRVLWPTLGVALLFLVIPVFKGVLQGHENFWTLGWVGIADGFLRLSGMVVAVMAFHVGAVGAMGVAFGAMSVSTVVAAWSSRSVWMGPGAAFRWGPWLAQVLPFTLGAGAMLVLANFDLIFLKAIIPESQADHFLLGERYQPAFMVGFGITQVTVPLAMVMFPKIVRGAAGGGRTDALALALIGTAVVGAVVVGFVTIFPKLPLQILYLRSPARWAAAPIVPWSAWAMMAYALANVLVSNLLAQERYWIVPWTVAVAVAFIGTLFLLKNHLLQLEPFAAFRLVAQTIGGFNLLLLVIAAFFTWGHRPKSPAPAPTGSV